MYNNIARKMKNTFLKILILSLCLFGISCKKSQKEPVQIRIVDLQGKPGRVVTKTPDLNVSALQQQGRLANTSYVNSKEEQYSNNKYNEVPQDSLRETLNAPQGQFAPANQDSNVNYGLDTKSAKADTSLSPSYDLNNASAKEGSNNKIKFDLKKDTKKSAKKAPKKARSKKIYKPIKNGWYVQVGSFKYKSNAKRALKKMEKFHSGKIRSVKRKDREINRVLLGPFAKKSQASSLLNKVKKAGHDAILVK